jgi:hypothetical protein
MPRERHQSRDRMSAAPRRVKGGEEARGATAVIGGGDVVLRESLKRKMASQNPPGKGEMFLRFTRRRLSPVFEEHDDITDLRHP